MPYSLVELPVVINPEFATKELAEYKKRFEASISVRLNELIYIVNHTFGFEDWLADFTPKSVHGIGRWFAANIQLVRELTVSLLKPSGGCFFLIPVSDTVLTYRTVSMCFDLGIYLSQALLKGCPCVEWQQILRSRKDVDYGQLVLKGTGNVPLNPVRLLVISPTASRQDGARGKI